MPAPSVKLKALPPTLLSKRLPLTRKPEYVTRTVRPAIASAPVPTTRSCTYRLSFFFVMFAMFTPSDAA